MKAYLAEAIGTMLLVVLACGSAVLAGPSIGVLGIGLCFGLTLLALAFAIGNVSGCHVNPAVSLAMLLAGRMEPRRFVPYVLAQLIGAVAGAGILWAITGTATADYHFGGTTGQSYLATNVLQPGATSGMALLVETVLTAFFVFVILASTDANRGCGRLAPIAIGLALGLVNIVGIPVDNCSVNPARSFGPAVFDPTAWPSFWIMVVGPCLGAVIAVVAWTAITREKSKA